MRSTDASLRSDEAVELTGVMDYTELKEVVIFFDHLYPRWLTKLAYSKFWGPLVKPFYLSNYEDQKVKEHVLQMVNNGEHPLPAGALCENFVPLKRDGGAFVKFLVPPDSSTRALVADIEANMQDYFKGSFSFHKRSIWTRPPRASFVKGSPWIEDLSRFPSRKLKVIFEGSPLTEEEMYFLFRRYGLIEDIVPQASSTPYAVVSFKSTDSCINAKNCVTGMKFGEGKTTLHLQYIPIQRVNHVTLFISNHQRIAIPVILALLATIAVLIFEPIRKFFISMKIRHYYSWEAHKDKWYIRMIFVPYSMIASRLSDGRHFIDDSLGTITGYRKQAVELEDLESDLFWSERSEKATQLKLWVCENANTFIVVKGPKGLAKREFVIEHALSLDTNFKNRILEIDCADLIKARSDTAFLKTAANQLGYFPLFTWANSVSQFADLGLQGLTGQKTGLSESKETQFKNMLLLAQVAIRDVALADFAAYKCEFERQQKLKLTEQKVENPDSKVVMAREDDYLQMHPDVKPVIIVNNFLRRSESPQEFIYKALADWAGQLILNNVAHVIFITLDSGSTLHLATALPNQVLKTISLDDASDLSAKQYVTNQLREVEVPQDIDTCLEPLGGRMLDLQAFVRRVKSGEEPRDALSEMIHQASEQITTFYLNISETERNSETPWNTAQLWALIRVLAKNDRIEIDDLVQLPLFALNLETMQTLAVLEKNDLIRLKREQGIVKTISTGRPLYKAAFIELVKDEKVFKLYETYFYGQLISLENVKINKLEEQVSRLSNLNDQKFMKDRIEYLSGKINACSQKVQDYEKKVKDIGANGAVKKLSSFFGF